MYLLKNRIPLQLHNAVDSFPDAYSCFVSTDENGNRNDGEEREREREPEIRMRSMSKSAGSSAATFTAQREMHAPRAATGPGGIGLVIRSREDPIGFACAIGNY